MKLDLNSLKLPFCLLLGLFLAYYLNHGIILSDEYKYAENAWHLANGTFTNSGHAFENRFGLILPMSIAIHFLGTQPWVLFLWTTICFLGLLSIVYFLLKKQYPKLAFWSTLFLAVNPILTWHGLDIAQDVVLSSFLFTSILLIWKVRQPIQTYSPILLGSITALCFSIAFATKTTALFTIPFIGLIFLLDIKNRKYFSFWSAFSLTSCCAGVAYLYAYYYYTGDPFFRLNGLNNSYLNNLNDPFSYVGKSGIEKLKRITILPIAVLLKSPSFGIWAVLALVSLKKFNFKKWETLPNFLTIYLFIVFGWFWLGTLSFAEYVPLTFADRMMIPVLPAFVIVSVHFLMTKSNTYKKGKLLYLLAAAVCCIILVVFRERYITFAANLGLFSILSFSAFYTKLIEKNSHLLLLLIIGFIGSHYFVKQDNQRYFAYFEEKRFVQQLDIEKETLIITDFRTAKFALAYSDFLTTPHIQFIHWQEIQEQQKLTNQQIFLFYNRNRMNLYAPAPKPLGKLVYESPLLLIHQITANQLYELDAIK